MAQEFHQIRSSDDDHAVILLAPHGSAESLLNRAGHSYKGHVTFGPTFLSPPVGQSLALRFRIDDEQPTSPVRQINAVVPIRDDDGFGTVALLEFCYGCPNG